MCGICCMIIEAVGLHGPLEPILVYYPIGAIWWQLRNLYWHLLFFLCCADLLIVMLQQCYQTCTLMDCVRKHLRTDLGTPMFTFLLLTCFLFRLWSLLTHVWNKGCDGLMAALLQHSDFVKGAWEVAVHCTVHDTTYIITVYKVASLCWSSPRLDLVPNRSLLSPYHTSKHTSPKP